MDYDATKHGADNKGLEIMTGYCQAVSGLCEMTDEYDSMFTAEGRYWLRYKQDNPNTWKAKLSRLKHSRGTIFTTRLLKCFKWLERHKK